MPTIFLSFFLSRTKASKISRDSKRSEQTSIEPIHSRRIAKSSIRTRKRHVVFPRHSICSTCLSIFPEGKRGTSRREGGLLPLPYYVSKEDPSRPTPNRNQVQLSRGGFWAREKCARAAQLFHSAGVVLSFHRRDVTSRHVTFRRPAQGRRGRVGKEARRGGERAANAN